MKARRKSDGKIVEVETYMLNNRRGKDGLWESSYKDNNSGLVYEASALDFNFDTDTVIQGWVCRDEDGILHLFTEIPTLEFSIARKDHWWYSESTARIDATLFPDLTWESEPEPVDIIIKRKKK